MFFKKCPYQGKLKMRKQKTKISQLKFVRLLKNLKPDERICLINYLNDDAIGE